MINQYTKDTRTQRSMVIDWTSCFVCSRLLMTLTIYLHRSCQSSCQVWRQ